MLFVIYGVFLLNNVLLTNYLVYAIDDAGICKKSESSEFCAVANLTSFGKIRQKRKSELSLTPLQIINHEGYPLETHSDIETSDGYLLTLHRMPCGKGERKGKNKPVVFLMHGLSLGSFSWILLGPKLAIAYQLVDEGYDVWMGNARGTTWSRKHVTYNPNRDSEFWDFSWHQIGTEDLPTMIDYILENTGQKQMVYIGNSQGTTTGFVLLSEKPEYNNKIKLMIALGPVAYVSHVTNPLFRMLGQFASPLRWITNTLSYDEALTNNPLLKLLGQKVCNDKSQLQFICARTYFLLFGVSSNQLNPTMIPVFAAHYPGGSSVKQILHYAQEVSSGKFCQYDYGFIQNMFKYKSLWPPDYKIENIVAPVALFYSASDLFTPIADIMKLKKKLPNLVLDYLISDKKFNHADFIMGLDARNVVYNEVLKLMKKYQ